MQVCFTFPQNQCSCKENVEGMLCDRCKDLFFNLHLANPKGCIPCKCDRSGTLNGIATCDRNSGQCYCKRNVDARSRTCDVCKDGFYGLDKSDVFGCKRELALHFELSLVGLKSICILPVYEIAYNIYAI